MLSWPQWLCRQRLLFLHRWLLFVLLIGIRLPPGGLGLCSVFINLPCIECFETHMFHSYLFDSPDEVNEILQMFFSELQQMLYLQLLIICPSWIAANAATVETATALYFNSMMDNINGKIKRRKPVTLFIMVCSTTNFFWTTNPETTLMIFIAVQLFCFYIAV